MRNILFRKNKILFLTVITILTTAVLTLFIFGCNTSTESTTAPTVTTTTIANNGDSTSSSWLTADTTDPTLDVPTVRTTGPTDWRDEIIYFILTDRFKDGDASNNDANYQDTSKINYYHGGDLQGIIDEVDYIRKLGMTSIWITPVVENVKEDNQYCGYHGYWAHDMTKIDTHLADSTADYKTFVDTMHNNGILVIQDIVVNHMGNIALYKIGGSQNWNPTFNSSGYSDSEFVWVEDEFTGSWVTDGLRTKPTTAPFNDKSFYNKCGENDNSTSGTVLGDLSGLEDIKTSDPTNRTYLINIYSDWIKWAGVDGFRIDTVKHVEETFWDVFCPGIRNTVNTNYPGKKFLQFGEALLGLHSQCATYMSGSRLDSNLNFELFFAMKEQVMIGTSGTSRLTTELSNRSNLRDTTIDSGGGEVSAQDAVINFVDNHDEGRFLSYNGATVDNYRLALMYIMTTKGIPCIYYNSENDISASDTDGRADMPDFTTTGKKTFTLIRKLAKIRKDNISLRRGDIKVLKDSDTQGIFAFVRYNGTDSENVFVVLNTYEYGIEATIPVSAGSTDYASNGDTLENILYKEFGLSDEVTVSSGSFTTTVEANSMKIFKKK